jgi:hypothetical protein
MNVIRPRRVAWFVGAVLVAVLAPLVAVTAFGLLAPFADAPIPTNCTGAVSLLPPGRELTVPGIGTGIRLVQKGDSAVVVVPSGDRIPAGGTAYIVDTRTGRVILNVRIASSAVAAAIDGDAVYLFDDKLGYLVHASDGSKLSRFIESDNYRGLMTSGSGRFIQTDAWVWILGGDGGPLSIRHIGFTSIVDGCLIP